MVFCSEYSVDLEVTLNGGPQVNFERLKKRFSPQFALFDVDLELTLLGGGFTKRRGPGSSPAACIHMASYRSTA